MTTSKKVSTRAVTAQALNTKLNVVLDKMTINKIVRSVIGRNGGKIIGRDGVSINDGHCCVDASVGSSVVGPVSTVGSSVSHHPEKIAGIMKPMSTRKKSSFAGSVKKGPKTKVSVSVPKQVKVK